MLHDLAVTKDVESRATPGLWEIIDRDWCIAAPILTPAYVDHVVGQIADELGIELPEVSS
ncbi:hypothetical protein QNA24_22375 [Rhodococcus qingshengii]|uniref:hypothetical protein n=1 Tax=Rhodococcus qingshengii TaxID=334542 RepID=UPI0024B8B9FD|nr:hypothetical protein [Rhodococcus qingshengii]MDJ0489127.1 hypothetical protein [Rhodococcus qingshengii]